MAIDVLLTGQGSRSEKQHRAHHGQRQQSLDGTVRLAGTGRFHGKKESLEITIPNPRPLTCTGCRCAVATRRIDHPLWGDAAIGGHRKAGLGLAPSASAQPRAGTGGGCRRSAADRRCLAGAATQPFAAALLHSCWQGRHRRLIPSSACALSPRAAGPVQIPEQAARREDHRIAALRPPAGAPDAKRNAGTTAPRQRLGGSFLVVPRLWLSMGLDFRLAVALTERCE